MVSIRFRAVWGRTCVRFASIGTLRKDFEAICYPLKSTDYAFDMSY